MSLSNSLSSSFSCPRAAGPATRTLLFLLTTQTLIPLIYSMCYEPGYKAPNYLQSLSRKSQYVVLGRVLDRQRNQTHQSVRVHVSCVYKGPGRAPETLLDKQITFTMRYFKNVCDPLLEIRQLYVFHLEMRQHKLRQKRRKKKKKKDFGLMLRRSKLRGEKYVPLNVPGSGAVPLSEISSVTIDTLVNEIRDQGYTPVGECFNVWTPWSSCSTKCNTGAMSRHYPRYNQTQLSQTAVCHNAPCPELHKGASYTRNYPQFQYQTVSIGGCESMELVRVKYCSDTCPRTTQISTAIKWEMYLTLMLCQEDGEELRYYNIAITHTCACVAVDSVEKYANVVLSPATPTRRKRHRLL